MSLSGTLYIGRSALAATQTAIQTVGNNIAGASDPNYTRQIARIGSAPGQQIQPGVFIGAGIRLEGVERQIDDALMQRLRGGIADGAGSGELATWLEQVESVFNELGDDDLSSQLSRFFKSWSDVATRPTDMGARQVAVAEGKNLARSLNGLDLYLDGVLEQSATRLDTYVRAADDLAGRIAKLNDQISTAEAGLSPSANGLRDNRDALLGELAQYVNIHTIEQNNGAVNVYVGSEPLVEGGFTNGLALVRKVNADGSVTHEPRFRTNNAPLEARAGKIGGTDEARRQVEETRQTLDAFAGGLIFELNKLHAAGQGLRGYEDVTGSNQVQDTTAALDLDAGGLPFAPKNGSLALNLRDKATGKLTSTLIDVSLDGSAAGTSLNDLAGDLNAITGVTATITGGRLRLRADSPGQEITFSQDTSGVMAALGIGVFFTGDDAGDIAVSEQLEDVRRLAVSSNNLPADNTTARAIAALQEQSLGALGGGTLNSTYEAMVFKVASGVAGAQTRAEGAESIRQTLEAQRQAMSGVSLDEEAVSLMRYQRSYQGAARLIAAVDEMMQTVLSLV